jgi:hypothetical protein
MKCAKCRGELGPGPYARKDTCPQCQAELHACVQCGFYAPDHYNDCREPQAERVLDSERANYCDYFRPAGGADGCREADETDAVRARLAALFPKKSNG